MNTVTLTDGTLGSNSINSDSTPNVATTFSYTCPVGTDCLVLAINSGSTTSNPGVLPTSVTYDGIPLKLVVGSFVGADNAGSSIWYLRAAKLTTGSSRTVSVTFADALNLQGTLLLPLVGVDQVNAPYLTVTTNTALSTSASVAISGATTSDLYVGTMHIPGSTTATATGTGQTQLSTLTERSSGILSIDKILGTAAGTFAWTVVSGKWISSAVTFLAARAVPETLPVTRRPRLLRGNSMQLDTREWW